jgi:hypothetical protein
MPEYVKKAEVEDLSSLADSDFALVIESGNEKKRKFPINTPANATLSQEYFADSLDSMSLSERVIAATNIARALEKFGLIPNKVVQTYVDESINSNKFKVEKAEPIGYLLEFGGAKLFPYTGPDDINKYFAAYHSLIKQMIPEEISIFNKRLKEAASTLGVEIPPDLLPELAPEQLRSEEVKSKVAEKYKDLPLSKRLKLKALLEKRAMSKDYKDRLKTAIALRRSVLGDNQDKLSKLAMIEELLDRSPGKALDLLDAFDKFLCPGFDLAEDLSEGATVQEIAAVNPLIDAILKHQHLLRNMMDEETYMQLLEDPESFMESNPVVKRVILRIVKL